MNTRPPSPYVGTAGGVPGASPCGAGDPSVPPGSLHCSPDTPGAAPPALPKGNMQHPSGPSPGDTTHFYYFHFFNHSPFFFFLIFWRPRWPRSGSAQSRGGGHPIPGEAPGESPAGWGYQGAPLDNHAGVSCTTVSPRGFLVGLVGLKKLIKNSPCDL